MTGLGLEPRLCGAQLYSALVLSERQAPYATWVVRQSLLWWVMGARARKTAQTCWVREDCTGASADWEAFGSGLRWGAPAG